ncbi:MAG: glycoside hydrolase family 99-like domain-containing protein [Planctomycetota bacterium]
MSSRPPVFAYVYTGWHPIAERDEAFHEGFTEWELVRSCRPQFEGHAQPRVPALGEYDDRDPEAVGQRVRLAVDHGIDGLVFGVFWCRGKRVFEDGLDRGFLQSVEGDRVPFACMWSNRMPRRVLPVPRDKGPVIDPGRRVDSDVADFVAFVEMLEENYFRRPNYLRIGGCPYLSIFDSSFFVRELGDELAAEAIASVREMLLSKGYPGLHLVAVEPNDEVAPKVARLGFDSVTHYVFLPDWKGPYQQDYSEMAELRASQWASFAERCQLPYSPSVTPGWDATPRGADFGDARPDRYPWSPVVVGEGPAEFEQALRRALEFRSPVPGSGELPILIASLNEWSEGHVLEPCERFGTAILDTVRSVTREPLGS